MKNFVVFALVLIFTTTAGLFFYFKLSQKDTKEMLYPLVIKIIESIPDETKPKEQPKPASELANQDVINILLLGIDRRSRSEGYRTDIMILLSIDKKDKTVVLTSVPRDLWVQGGRINALYLQQGWEGVQSAFNQITGQKPDRFILTDFADFTWLVNAMDGVPVTVENAFTDTEYPVDVTKTYQTVTFTTGPEKLTGTRALIFARSRHGNNGEGSDWMRMKRQHLILKGMLSAVLQPKSIFNPMVVENAFKTVTEGKVDTNLTLDDTKFLWDFYKDKDAYTYSSLFMNSDFVYNPPMSDYGGAWVLVPRDPSNLAFHQAVENLINKVEVATKESTPSQIN